MHNENVHTQCETNLETLCIHVLLLLLLVWAQLAMCSGEDGGAVMTSVLCISIIIHVIYVWSAFQ